MRASSSLRLAVFVAAAVASAGCASRGARGRGLAERLGGAAGASRTADARGNAGPTGLPRIASLRTDTPSYGVIEAAPRPVPPPPGEYGPVGAPGYEPPPYSEAPCPCPYPYGSGVYVPGGSVPYPIRAPFDPPEDRTGLAGAVRGASPYRDPTEADGSAHRPGISTGTGPFAHAPEAETAPAHSHTDHHGR